MQITLTFDTTTPKDTEVLMALLGNLSPSELANFASSAQPEVAGNTGSTATGFNLSPEGSGVSGAGEAIAAAADPAPAPVKEKRTRKPKDEAPAPVAQPEPEPAPHLEAEAKTYTLDEVRAALQQFTAKSGVPAGIDLLKSFNAGRISELEADDYAAFVERCAA